MALGRGLSDLIPEKSGETESSAGSMIGAAGRESLVFAVYLNGKVVARFDHVSVHPSGVLECHLERKGHVADAFYAPGQWDVVCRSSQAIELEYGLRFQETDGGAAVILMVQGKPDALKAQDHSGGEIVHRMVGPWEPL